MHLNSTIVLLSIKRMALAIALVIVLFALSQHTPVSSQEPGTTVYLPFLSNTYVPTNPSIFGVQFYDPLDSSDAALNLAPGAHVYWVRYPVSWSAIEPVNTTPDNYNYSALDGAVLAAARYGIRLVITIQNNPSWAATYANGVIDQVGVSEFAQFVGALAARYNGVTMPAVDYWELYNEPDGGSQLAAEYNGAAYWGPFGTLYAQMMCAVYPAVKSANPNARVALGGLAYDSFTDQGGGFTRSFLEDVLDAGGGSCMDAVNFHYYPVFAANWNPYGPGLAGKANYIRSTMQAHGVTKRMIVTESGWHSNNFSNLPSTPQIQSRFVVELFNQAVLSGSDIMIWWTWKDPGPDAGANGLITQAFQPKPSYTAYRVVAEKLNWNAASLQRALTASELGSSALEGYLYVKPGRKSLYVLWSDDGVNRNVTLPLSQARVTDMYGTVVANLSSLTGSVQILVGSDPLYVEVP